MTTTPGPYRRQHRDVTAAAVPTAAYDPTRIAAKAAHGLGTQHPSPDPNTPTHTSATHHHT
ncbi:hypothetical protein ACQ4WX_24135 [Streptomyces lasalocidi]